MARIRGRDTGPEMAVRRIVDGLGCRMVLNAKELPGKPDIVIPESRKIIFINGCFWHGCNCRNGRIPKTRTEWWTDKIATNKRRDRRNQRILREYGWSIATIWEHELKDEDRTAKKLKRFLACG